MASHYLLSKNGRDELGKPKIGAEAVRAVGVTFGGPFLLSAATVTAARSLTRSLISRDAPRKSALLMLAGALFESGRALGLEGWGLFLLEPIDEKRTRLIGRGRIPKGMAALFYEAFVELPHFIMQRRMLLGIKRRAEALYAEDQAQNQHQTRSDDDPDAGL